MSNSWVVTYGGNTPAASSYLVNNMKNISFMEGYAELPAGNKLVFLGLVIDLGLEKMEQLLKPSVADPDPQNFMNLDPDPGQ